MRRIERLTATVQVIFRTFAGNIPRQMFKRRAVAVAALGLCLTAHAESDTWASSSEPARNGSTVTIALSGDILMGTTYPTVRLPADDGRQLFSDATPILRAADIAVGNLEGTLCDEGETKKKLSGSSYAFRTPRSYAGVLSAAGYDFVSMANNHAHDFGSEGIVSTEQALDSVGIGYAGIGGRAETSIITRGGLRFGLCAFGHNSYTLLTWDTLTVAHILRTLRPKVDIVIVSFHGGAEGAAYSHLPDSMEIFLKERRGYLREFAHFCIRHGADVVYGHGPHVPRCIELYKDRFIAYSLGNFCTPYGISIKGVSGLAPLITVRTTIHGRFIDARIHSFKQTYGLGPRRDSANRAARQIRTLTESDITDGILEILDDGYVRRKKRTP